MTENARSMVGIKFESMNAKHQRANKSAKKETCLILVVTFNFNKPNYSKEVHNSYNSIG